MPAVRTYIVTQEREVKIPAESPSAAIAEAQKHLDGDASNTARIPRETEIRAREEF
jgi:hypothetical protein